MSPVLIAIGIIATVVTAVFYRYKDQRHTHEPTHRMGFTVNAVLYTTCVFVAGFLTAALLVNLFYNRF